LVTQVGKFFNSTKPTKDHAEQIAKLMFIGTNVILALSNCIKNPN